MQKKLNRRELVQAGLVTTAAFALGGSTAALAGPAEGESTYSIQSLQDLPPYSHQQDCCDPPGGWHSGLCPGNPNSYTGCAHKTTVSGSVYCSCSHRY